MLRSFTFFVLLCAISPIHCRLWREHLMDAPRLFQFLNFEEPNYEVVSIIESPRKSGENAHAIALQYFNRTIDLHLVPTEDFLISENTPVYTVQPHRRYPHGLKYTHELNALYNLRAYQDLKNKAAVVVEEVDPENHRYFGFVNDMTLHPVTNDWLEKQHAVHLPWKHKRDVNGGNIHDPSIPINPHIIFRANVSKDTQHTATLARSKREKLNRKDHPKHHNHYKHHHHRNRRLERLPKIIYPEILVIMDYGLYKNQGENLQSALIYLISFWNAVDLRYRSMRRPEIRLNIAGIVISIVPGGVPYLDNHAFFEYKQTVPKVNAELSIEHMSKYFGLENRFPPYDLAMTMTTLNLCSVEEGYCHDDLLGIAYEGGACRKIFRRRVNQAVGLAQDNGGYSGIFVVTHEVGHLLGAGHDDDHAPGCQGEYIMSARADFGEQSFYWSNCSKTSFRQFFRSGLANCLFDNPASHGSLSRILPGTVQSLDDQCQKAGGIYACNGGSSVCIKLKCYMPHKKSCHSVAAAAEGSICGRGKRCLSGRCVHVDF